MAKNLKRLGNVGIILALLILSAPFYWLQIYFFTKIVIPTADPDIFNFSEPTVGKAYFFEGLNFACFSVAHWIFAILMWFTASKLT